jgi:hypothetical protein
MREGGDGRQIAALRSVLSAEGARFSLMGFIFKNESLGPHLWAQREAAVRKPLLPCETMAIGLINKKNGDWYDAH